MDDKRPVKVLQVAHDLTMGGVPADIMYPARILDSSDVSFDVLLTSDTAGYYDEEFKKYGRIFRIPVKRGKNKLARAARVFLNPYLTYHRAKRFFRTHINEYDAVHCRNFEYNAPCIFAAYKAGIPVRITHSHVNSPGKEYPHIRLYNAISRRILNRYATMRLGVTQGALEYMIGKKGKGYVIKNPTVDLSKFDPKKYDYPEHSDVRLIMVGSIQPRKNQLFGAQILKELHDLGAEASITYIGYPTHPESGYLERVQDYLKDCNLSGKAVFLPKDSNVADALARADVMLLPSTQEGLPNTALEAQAMGVYCFVSTNVERVCDCGLCEFADLNAGPKSWAEAILSYAKRSGLKKQFIDMSDWDNREVSKFHLRIWKGENPFEKVKRGG